MNPKAIKQAILRLEKAKAAVARLATVTTYADTESAWPDFLAAASTMYSKIEQGSKASGTSKAWFGRKKKERKDDALLSYIHHARNSDEHGIEDVTSRHRGYSFANPIGVTNIHVPEGSSTWDVQIIDPDGTVETANVQELETVRLVTVTDSRYGDSFYPPASHLDTKLSPVVTPLEVATVALVYLEALIVEENTFVPTA